MALPQPQPPASAPDRVHHPFFARAYTLMMRAEPAELREHRPELVAGLAGRVIEVGAGTGVMFEFYPSTVTEVVAVEPEEYLRAQATAAAATAPLPVSVIDGTAEALPAPDDSFDAAVCCLVLCSVHDPRRALAELHRVLRPGGELRYYEHVLSHKPAVARTQRLVDRMGWPWVSGGCHTARDTPATIAAGGFAIEQERRMLVGPRASVAVRTHAMGCARSV